MNIFDSIFKNIKNSDMINGLSSELKGLYTYQYFKKYNKPVIYLTSTIYEANKMYQCLLNYTNDVLFFPMDDFLTSVALAVSPEFKMKRLETLNELVSNSNKIVVTNLMGYLRYLPPVSEYKDRSIFIQVNKEYDFNKIIDDLISYGYDKTSIVNKSGEIAVRGFVIDIFPINLDLPVRIELWGEEVEKISYFDIDTQLTVKKIDSVKIDSNIEKVSDVDEILSVDNNNHKVTNFDNHSIVDYIPDSAIMYDDIDGIYNNYKLLLDEISEYIVNNDLPKSTKFMNEFSEIKKDATYFMSFDNKKELVTGTVYNSYELDLLKGNVSNINMILSKYINEGKTVIILVTTRYKANKLIDDLNNKDLILSNLDNIKDNKINLVVGRLNSGYIIDNYVVITERELYNKKESNNVYRSKFRMGSAVRDLNKLNIGDYIVHSQHGIGKYVGIKTLEKDHLKKDYLALEYAGGDKVYIPVEKIETISKYSGNEGALVKLNKLGGSEWQKTKMRIKKKIESIATDLLSLYSKRETSIGFSFSKDTEEQLIFENEFPFTETKDQLRVTDEIKKDMEKSIPMDRLLCGDVGYGKTEVAFRAAFKAMMDSKQVAILCPTTILSSQHYQNALERFKTFPVNIALLNRFVTPSNQKKVLSNVKEGKIDLLIGTHRILSDDIDFKNLGLLIIDEEQRFGVKHKEKIKHYKNSIDVLTMSATPIPRTLQMSMAGVRSLSLIETPPVNRYPVQTYVLEENKQIIKDAIYKELARHGQAFILYNHVEDIDLKMDEIKHLVPEARIVFAHGRMSKTELEDIMLKFMEGEYDVLICTTIIETGIDIPNVNTLIIIDADRFGLSQLYQIRGRVGRSDRIAYCYLMYNKGKILSEIATKRLNVIKEFTELGSGFSIAMRDLSIRGAGDILGSEQAGFIDSVGIELFLSMLNEEISKLKGIEIKEEVTDSQPLITVATAIDDNYIKDEDIKIEIHKKINSIKSSEDLERVKYEIEDRFGRLDENLIIYMHEELFESIARSLDIFGMKQTKNFIELTLSENLTSRLNGESLFLELLSISRKFRFSMKLKRLTITLDTINLDKHFIYYLIDLVGVIKNNINE